MFGVNRKKKIKQLEAELAEAEKASDSDANEITNLLCRIEELEEANAGTAKLLESWRNQNKKLSAHVAANVNEMDDLKHQNSLLEKEVSDYRVFLHEFGPSIKGMASRLLSFAPPTVGETLGIKKEKA